MDLRRYIMTEEDLALEKENKKARQYYDDNGIRALGAAVCLQAAKDYQSNPSQRSSIRPFFDGPIFSFFFNGESVDSCVHTILKSKELKTQHFGYRERNELYENGTKSKHNKYVVVMPDGKIVERFKDSFKKAKKCADDVGGDIFCEDKCVYSATMHDVNKL